MRDHFMFRFAPLPALQAVADATTTLRVTRLVLAADFRHPAVLAKELATVDVLSGGRLEVGIGAGWKQEEFEQAGIRFDKASVRIERLEEHAIVLKGLFGDGPFSFSGKYFTVTEVKGSPHPAQRPRPPIMIGGGGPKVLSVAARQADIVQVMPSAPQGLPAGRHAFTLDAF
jgi:probable F420-dependent oxidoreductase